MAARAAYLPKMAQRRKEIDLSNRALDIDKKRLESEIAYQNKSLAANEEAAQDSMNLAKANLGISTVMGAAGLQDAIFGGGGGSPSGSPAAMAPAVSAASSSPGVASTSVDPASVTKIGRSGFNLPSIQNLVGMAGGGYAGYKLGGDSTVGKVAGAAGGALIGDALTGGTLYKDVANFATEGISTIWEGAKSLFSSFF
jgi:hypothetical protein